MYNNKHILITIFIIELSFETIYSIKQLILK